MKHYQSYMNRQQISDDLRRRLLELEPPAVPRPGRRGRALAALAACCALIAGVGLWGSGLLPVRSPEPVTSSPASSAPISADQDAGAHSFVAEGTQDGEGKLSFLAIPYVEYADLTAQSEVLPSIALSPGTYTVDLTQEQICLILWGGEEAMQSAPGKAMQGNLPWMLNWDGYTISGQAWYDGSGQLWQVAVFGTLDDSHSFTLLLAPDRIPPTCLVESGAAVTTVNGTEVSAWKRHYDRNGDGQTEWVYTSELLAGGVGLRFQAVTREDSLLSDLLVLWATGEHLSLEHLLTNDQIPAWRDARFSTLEQARQETAFAPYLPADDLPGYSEFEGFLSYQEGCRNQLSLSWRHGMDDVFIQVCLPEGDSPYTDQPMDVTVPESYDVRLYEIPWADLVPEEYRLNFSSPTFAAGDMSREIVAARAYTPNEQGDTNSLRIQFQVLHENGVLVKYSLESLTVDQAWALVEATL